MEDIKNFIKEHKKEIAIVGGLIFVYRLGFKAGCNATDKAVTNVFRNMDNFVRDSLKITKF